EYANILAESKALERYQAGEKASPFFFDMDSLYIPTGNPVRQEDYLKGDAVKPEDPAAAQQALKALEAGKPAPEEAGRSLAESEQQAQDGQAAQETIEDLTAAIDDYNKFLDAAKEEGVPVGAGYTITTYTGEDGQLMHTIDEPNSCGLPFPAKNPPPALQESLKKMLSEIAERKKDVAAAKEKLAKDKEAAAKDKAELMAANSNASNPESCLNCRKTTPAPGEEPPVTASGTEDSGSPDERDAGPGDENGETGPAGGKGNDMDNAGHQADLIASAFTATPVAGIVPSGSLKDPVRLTFQAATPSESMGFLWANTQPMRDMSGNEPPRGGLLDGVVTILSRSAFLNGFWDHNTSKAVEVQAAPADSIFPTKQPAAPEKPSRVPADNKGT
ncbi:MAG: hypothetical protein HZB91_14310, partial [Elusimicrobia bacterium]|nr:hypothetical protein [Elusimicrobiota bacterium]